MDFSDLDPHQKGILSDDFGVALATQWLVERLGPFTHIVDGRRFANQFPRLLRKKHKSKPKVGMSKAPDFVMRDTSGKWHVLECKGTQTSRDYQRQVLKTAVAQKHAIQLLGSIQGEQLASSLYIAHANDMSQSHMKVIDPDDDDPLIQLTEEREDEMEAKATRLAVAQALGSIGLNEIAVEMSLPLDADLESELLMPSERARLHSSRDARVARATERTRARDLQSFVRHHRRYEGRVVDMELPPTGLELPFRRVRIHQGVTSDLIEQVSAPDSQLDHRSEERLRAYTASARVAVEAAENRTALTYGDVLYSEVEWL
jgi:hypothetical protein